MLCNEEVLERELACVLVPACTSSIKERFERCQDLFQNIRNIAHFIFNCCAGAGLCQLHQGAV